MKPGRPTAARWVRCPGCGRQALYGAENPARPFCSLRCRSIDLGAWASESYRVDAGQPDSDVDPAPGSDRDR
jgi:uncharacterized protein